MSENCVIFDNSSLKFYTTLSLLIFVQGCASSGGGKCMVESPNAPFNDYKVGLCDKKIEAPGYFDVGAGFGVIQRSGPDVKGVLVSFKGYPFGRWYSKEKKSSPMDILSLSQEVEVDCSNTATANGVVEGGAEEQDKKKCEENKLRKIVDLTYKIDSLYKNSGEYKEIRERSNWYNRLSVFYARSPENFTGGSLDTTVDALGIGIDITPEFSLIVGGATYENTDGGISNDYVFGVSLNLNAFNFLNGN